MRQSLAKPKHCRQGVSMGIPKINPATIRDMGWKERIKAAREQLGISKSEFARRVKVSAPTVTDWESGGIKMIDGANLVRAAEILHVTPEWLINGSGDADNDAVVEFAWVYRRATSEGRDFLRKSVAAARSAFVVAEKQQPRLESVKGVRKKD